MVVLRTTVKGPTKSIDAFIQEKLNEKHWKMQPEADRTAILDAIFSDRQATAEKLARATDPATRARLEKALQAHDYVYDVPPAAPASAA